MENKDYSIWKRRQGALKWLRKEALVVKVEEDKAEDKDEKEEDEDEVEEEQTLKIMMSRKMGPAPVTPETLAMGELSKFPHQTPTVNSGV